MCAKFHAKIIIFPGTMGHNAPPPSVGSPQKDLIGLTNLCIMPVPVQQTGNSHILIQIITLHPLTRSRTRKLFNISKKTDHASLYSTLFLSTLYLYSRPLSHTLTLPSFKTSFEATNISILFFK